MPPPALSGLLILLDARAYGELRSVRPFDFWLYPPAALEVTRKRELPRRADLSGAICCQVSGIFRRAARPFV